MLYSLNPLKDARWSALVEQHPRASVFHTTGWLRALSQTYGYEPVVYTTSAPEAELTSGVVFCSVRSWLTGRRLVSLPFSDHCDPLAEDGRKLGEIIDSLRRVLVRERLKYVEIRPLRPDLHAESCMRESESFWIHMLDLRTPLGTLYQTLHKDSIQRKIRRAERERLDHQAGSSERLLADFYGLLKLTRRRHNLPPQPIEWFRNLQTCMAGRLTIHLAYCRQRAVAGILTLTHRDTLVYKYGCSDADYHRLGGMPFLFWKAIEEAKTRGLKEFDFGRSSTANQGLIRFKDQWGANRSMLSYCRISTCTRPSRINEFSLRVAKRIFALVPDGLMTAAGRLLYRHMA